MFAKTLVINFGNDFNSLPILFMESINNKKKFILVCAWCESEKSKKYKKKWFIVSHWICKKCSKKYF